MLNAPFFQVLIGLQFTNDNLLSKTKSLLSMDLVEIHLTDLFWKSLVIK